LAKLHGLEIRDSRLNIHAKTFTCEPSLQPINEGDRIFLFQEKNAIITIVGQLDPHTDAFRPRPHQGTHD
jgi:hypothetical protein